jgi:hypothetical protein
MSNASEAESVPPDHSRSSSKTVFDPCRNHPKSTKTPFKIHTCRCRVRRKRERLTSNGSIETDAVGGLRSHRRKFSRPRHFR